MAGRFHGCDGSWRATLGCVVVLGSRMGRVGPINDASSWGQMHMTRALLALDILIDVLDVRNHRILAWRELVIRSTRLRQGCDSHLRGHYTLLLLLLLLLLLHGRLGGTRSAT